MVAIVTRKQYITVKIPDCNLSTGWVSVCMCSHDCTRLSELYVWSLWTVLLLHPHVSPPTHMHTYAQHHVVIVHHFTGRLTKQCEVTVYIDGRQIWKDASLKAPTVTEVG